MLEFLLAVLLMELTPGPNMTTLAVLAATRGRAGGLAAVAGVATGLLLAGVAAGLGLAALVAGSPTLWNALRWGGVLVLLWLAWEGWQGSETSAGRTEGDPSSTKAGQAAGTADLGRLFGQGVLTNLLNPKAYVFYIAIMPRFVSAGAGSAFSQTLWLTVIYVAVATAVHTLIVLAAARATRVLSGRQAAVARKLLSAALAVVAVWLLLETRLP